MISVILKDLEDNLESQFGIKTVIEPSMVQYHEPNLRIKMESPVFERQMEAEYGDRTYGGRVYSGAWYKVEYPVTAILTASGNEKIMREEVFEESFKINRIFLESVPFKNPDIETVEFPGEYTFTLEPSGNELSRNEEGQEPFEYRESFSGILYFRYFEITEETARYNTLKYNEEVA